MKISLSTDGGNTYRYTLAASSTARIKVEAVDNIFFDVSNANFTIRLVGEVNGDDLAIIKAALGKRTGQAGCDARADLNKDGVVDARDLVAESPRHRAAWWARPSSWTSASPA